METIELTIDESLLAQVHQATSASHMTASDFMTVALERALRQRDNIARERRDAEGYKEHPQQPDEIEEWSSD
jgi:hypothetical protein